MVPGMRTSSFPGAVEDAILELSAREAPGGGSAAVRFLAAAGYGGRYYAVYANARRAAAVFAREDGGGMAAAAVGVRPGARDLSIHLEDLGCWPDAGYDPAFTALEFEALSARQIAFSWEAEPELIERGDGLEQFDAWSISGLKRFSNCAPVAGFPTRGALGITLENAAGTRTVTLYAGAAAVARGSRSGDGAVDLTALNASGVSGTVTLAYAEDVPLGVVFVEARWPAAYQIHHATGSLSFPRAPEAVAADDGTSNRFAYTSPRLAAGAYHAAVLPVSDSGVAAASATAQDVELLGPPEPPAGLAYSSGGASATEISWQASATPGATYRVYDSAIEGATDLAAPAATHATGSGTLAQTLPALAGYPGVRRVLVRAVSGGVEELNAELLRIEYDAAGNVVPARPNAPRVRALAVSNGLTVTVRALYFSAHEAAAAQDALLFMAALEDEIDYGSPVASAAWSDAVGGVRETAVAAAAPADGWYKVAVRAAAAGGTQDAGGAWERVYVSSAAPAAASVEARASR